MVKTKKDRYTLCLDDEVITVNTNYNEAFEQAERLKKEISKFNTKKKEEYFYGNIKVSNNMKITYHKYKKISNTSTLKAIDSLTMCYENEEALKEHFKLPKKSLFITYRAKGEIRTLPLLFRADKELFSEQKLLSEYVGLASDNSFLELLLNNKHISSSAKRCEDEFDKLRRLYEQRKFNVTNYDGRSVMRDFFIKFTKEDGIINYLHYRLLVNLLLSFENRMKCEEIADIAVTCDQEEEASIYNQVNMFEYAQSLGYTIKK